jgi:small-conductance mechanosensitive channel/CRP-like cAMP-binding protein
MRLVLAAEQHELFDALDTNAGVLAIVAFVLIALLLFTLARERRRQVLQPLVFLVLWSLAFAIEKISIQTGLGGHVPGVVATLFLFTSIGRSCFLLIIGALRGALGLAPDKIFLDVVMALIYLAIGITVLGVGGAETKELFQGSAIATLIVGLSLQSTLGNICSGLAIQIQRPFEVGDWIQFDDKREHIGKVREINWRATTAITLDDVEVIIPNSKLAELPLTNFTKPERWSRRSIYFTCPYAAPPKRVHSIVLAAIRGSWGVLDQPVATVVTNAFTERGVEYWLRFWTVEFDRRDGVDGEVRDRIWYSLNRAGIVMPISTHDVQLRQITRESEAESASHEAQSREKLLHAVPLFADLPAESLVQLALASRLAFFMPNEAIIRQGDEGSELFVVQTGEVAVSVRGNSGQDAELQRLGPGAFFGEMSLLAGDRRAATVRSTTNCELLVIDKPALATVFESAPQLVEVISNIVATRIAEKSARLAELPTAVAGEKESLVARAKRYFGLS